MNFSDQDPRVVVVLGASQNPDRYSHRAVLELAAHGCRVLPVNPAVTEIGGIPCVPSLPEVCSPVHTLSIYVGPARLVPLIGSVLALSLGRVIFNPGTECPEAESAFAEAGIECVRGCTLVMLRSGLF